MGMMMLIPIFSALSQTATAQWERWLHRFFLVGLLYRGLSTYSRGGFLAAAAMGVVMLWRSPKRLRMLVAAVVVTLAVTSVLPDAFWDRMRTITVDLEAQDGSARGRFHFWEVAGYMAAANPLTGVGLNGFSRSFSDYDPSHGAYGSYRAVHSAWFGMLADLGYPGLILFLAVIWSAFRSCRRALAAGRGDPAKRDLTVYATSMQASLVAYIVGATFVGGQYSEMFWHLIGLTVVLRNLAVQPVEGDARVAGAQPLPARAPRLRAAAR
jgi:probable O-glycosylation ligase (exosortase A-associated)